MIPLFDTSTPLAPLRDELRAAVDAVLDSERYILGPEVEAFEHEFAAYCGAEHAIGVANGTDAITIALRALGVGPGDEVVVPSFTFYASAEAIPPTGATPVFCDIDPETFCVTAETVRAALTPRTKAVIAVHLFGNVAPVAEIEALGVPGARGRRAGRRLDARRRAARRARAPRRTFSSSRPRTSACFGDGGAITTSDAAVADRVRMLRFHGSRDKVTYEHVGYNSRLDELQAAILRVQLPAPRRLGRRAPRRRGATTSGRPRRARRRCRAPVAGSEPAWHLYVVRHADVPTSSRGAERRRGSATRPTTARRCTASRRCATRAPGVELPATEEVARTHLAIPMSPVLTRAQADEVVAAARNAG